MADFTIRNDIGAAVFAILSGLSALFFTAWIFLPDEDTVAKQELPISPVPATEAEVSELKAKLSAAQKDLEAESVRRAELALQLSQSREAAVAYESEKAELIGTKERLLESRQALQGRVQALTARLSEASATGGAGLKKEVARLKKQIESERKACNDAKASLNAEIEKLQAGMDQALYGDQLKPAGDFPALDLPYLVNDPIKLNRKVRPVFIQLRGMKESGDLKKVYEKISKDGKATALHKVPFESGSAEVTAAETKKLAELLKGSPKGAKLLVVGYASTDGDAKSNYELSSKRASSVATKLASIEGVEKQSVQAVYFGQTTRFSEAEMAPNRIVEVWRVK